MNLVIAIKDLDGTVVDRITMPTDLTKVKYRQYLDFKNDSYDALNFFLANQENWYDDESNMIQYLQLLCNAITSWVGEDVNSIFHLPKGSESENASMIKAILKKEYDWETTKGTLYGLFGIIFKALMQYKGKLRTEEDSFFIHNGKKYNVPVIGKDSLGRPINPTMRVGQVLTALQKNKIYHSLKDNAKTAKEKSRFELKRQLTTLALMNDGVPEDPEKIETFINNMMVELKDINTVNGLDLVFFLTATLKT